MSPTLKALGIDRMSVPERLDLVDQIWKSILETPGEIPLTEAQQEDLNRRLDEYEADPYAGDEWPTVKKPPPGTRVSHAPSITHDETHADGISE